MKDNECETNEDVVGSMWSPTLFQSSPTTEPEQRFKQQFLVNLSHELRTPLNGIWGMTELLLDTSLSHEQADCVQKIQSSVNYLSHRINDMMDISSMEANNSGTDLIHIENKACDIRAVVKELTDHFTDQLCDKPVTLSSFVSLSNDHIVITDKTRIRQILWNVLNNACTFTNNGWIKLNVRCIGNDLEFMIQDTGCGMVDTHLFDLRFHPRLHTHVSKDVIRHEGMGMGLYLTKMLLSKMKGDIVIQSQKDIGTTVTMTVPVQLLVKEHVNDRVVRCGEKHVLVAEDNKVNQIIIRRSLEKHNIKVTVVPNGKLAVDFFAQHRNNIHLIIMDIQMPVMDGYEASRQIRQMDQLVPIIVASAGSNGIANQYKNKMALTDFLPKPFRSEELIGMVQKYIR